MPRPVRCRRIGWKPEACVFKPRGIPVRSLGEVMLTLDELEALRLADLEELYQEDAAKRMNVSRQTFGNIVASAHRKIADFLVNSKALRIEGGEVRIMERRFVCYGCKKAWTVPYGTGRPGECPECGGVDIHRAPSDRGWARGYGRGRGRCRRGAR